MSLTQRIMFGIVFPLMFCSIGGFFAKQGYLYFKTKRDKKRRCLSQTYGKIVSISSMTTGKRGRRSYFPTYEYMVGDEIIRVEINFGTTYSQYTRGDQVKIWYDENNPQYSYIDGYKEDTISSVGCLILGSIAVLCGLFVGFVAWIR